MRGIKNVTHTHTYTQTDPYLDQPELSGNVTFCVTRTHILMQVKVEMGFCVSTVHHEYCLKGGYHKPMLQ